MAAYTTHQTGNWSSSSTWTTTPPTGGPGIGDTVTFGGAHTVTIDGAAGPSANGIVKLGTGSGTCLTGASTTNGGFLIVANGNQLWMRGNTTDQSGGYFNIQLGTTAGAALYFDPPNSTTQFNISTSNWSIMLTCNGTLANPATVKTDFTRAGGTGLNGYIFCGNNGGLVFATYTNFTNLGDTSHWGTSSNPANNEVTNLQITNCTFTNAGYALLENNSWDKTLLFQNNIFTSSVGTQVSSVGYAAEFSNSGNVSLGSRTINLNSFDLGVYFNYYGLITTDNYFGGGWELASAPQWPTAANFAGNLNVVTANGGAPTSIGGSIGGNYFCNGGTDNPHMITCNVAATISNCIFEANNGAPSATHGKAFLTGTPSGSIAITLQNCIALPVYGGSGGLGYGLEMLNLFGASTDPSHFNTVDVLHCTIYCGGTGTPLGNYGSHYSENGATGAGQIGLFKANFFWGTTQISQASYKLVDVGSPTSGGTSNVVSPTNADYNGCDSTIFVNEPSTYTGNTYSFAGNGYQGNFTAYPGAHDVNGVSPSFVDNARNLAKWGGTAAGGGTATVAGALAQIAANPALITQASTGLIAYVLAGFRPQNSALEAASYPSDPSTADAAGNSWPGGNAGIGAMAYQSGQATIFRQSTMTGLGCGGEFFSNPLN